MWRRFWQQVRVRTRLVVERRSVRFPRAREIKDRTRKVINVSNIEELINIYNVFRDYAKHEDQLIISRLSFILTIHGFLYTAYAFTIQKQLEIAEKISDHVAQYKDDQIACYLDSGLIGREYNQSTWFVYTIAFVGICISISGFRSISAAKKSARSVKRLMESQARRMLKRRYGLNGTIFYQLRGEGAVSVILPSIAGAGNEKVEKRGFFVASSIPIILACSWIIAGYFEYPSFWTEEQLRERLPGIGVCHHTMINRTMAWPPLWYALGVGQAP